MYAICQATNLVIFYEYIDFMNENPFMIALHLSAQRQATVCNNSQSCLFKTVLNVYIYSYKIIYYWCHNQTIFYFWKKSNLYRYWFTIPKRFVNINHFCQYIQMYLVYM